MRNVTCVDCEEYKNEWCEKIIDSPCPDLIRDCQYFHEKDRDLVRVVRCKDCKHRYSAVSNMTIDGNETWRHECLINRIQIRLDWYCADGERRTDDR